MMNNCIQQVVAKVISFDIDKREYCIDVGLPYAYAMVDLHCCAPEQLENQDPEILIGKTVTFRGRPLVYLAYDLLEIKDNE